MESNRKRPGEGLDLDLRGSGYYLSHLHLYDTSLMEKVSLRNSVIFTEKCYAYALNVQKMFR